MINKECPKCNKIFSTTQCMNYHINNNVCEKKTNGCDNCGYIFKTKAMLKYHIEKKVCCRNKKLTNVTKSENKSISENIKLENIKDNKNNLTNDLMCGNMTTCDINNKKSLSNNDNMDFINDASDLPEKYKIKFKKFGDSIGNLENEISFLKGKLMALEENPKNVNNIEKQQINIIMPPEFLQLDTVPKLMKMVPDLLHNALSKHPTEFVSFLIKETNCNPQRPIFNCASITNKKDPFAKISDGKKFIYAPKKQVISQLIENKKSLLQEYVDKNGDKYII